MCSILAQFCECKKNDENAPLCAVCAGELDNFLGTPVDVASQAEFCDRNGIAEEPLFSPEVEAAMQLLENWHSGSSESTSPLLNDPEWMAAIEQAERDQRAIDLDTEDQPWLGDGNEAFTSEQERIRMDTAEMENWQPLSTQVEEKSTTVEIVVEVKPQQPQQKPENMRRDNMAITPKNLARQVGCSLSTVYRWIESGKVNVATPHAGISTLIVDDEALLVTIGDYERRGRNRKAKAAIENNILVPIS